MIGRLNDWMLDQVWIVPTALAVSIMSFVVVTVLAVCR